MITDWMIRVWFSEERHIFLFISVSRLAVWLTQPPIKWILGPPQQPRDNVAGVWSWTFTSNCCWVLQSMVLKHRETLFLPDLEATTVPKVQPKYWNNITILWNENIGLENSKGTLYVTGQFSCLHSVMKIPYGLSGTNCNIQRRFLPVKPWSGGCVGSWPDP
jgi:hypothetical protein